MRYETRQSQRVRLRRHASVAVGCADQPAADIAPSVRRQTCVRLSKAGLPLCRRLPPLPPRADHWVSVRVGVATRGDPITEERLGMAELLEKAGEGDFLRAVAEAVLPLLMETDVERSEVSWPVPRPIMRNTDGTHRGRRPGARGRRTDQLSRWYIAKRGVAVGQAHMQSRWAALPPLHINRFCAFARSVA